MGLRTSGPGVCKICHNGIIGRSTICELCSLKVKNEMEIPPNNRPLLHYCVACKADMFPPKASSQKRFGRICHVCDGEELATQRWRAARGTYDKTCHKCGYVARPPDDSSKDRGELTFCWFCEIVLQYLDHQGVKAASWREWLTGHSSHPNEGAIDFQKLPTRRHSTARKHLDGRKQALDNLRRTFGI
jgi:hypothetical protein